jgi:hypothetical protein
MHPRWICGNGRVRGISGNEAVTNGWKDQQITLLELKQLDDVSGRISCGLEGRSLGTVP